MSSFRPALAALGVAFAAPALGALGASAAGAQQPGGPPAGAAPGGRAPVAQPAGVPVRGAVVAAAGGRAVVGAAVTMRRAGAGADTGVVATARTDTAGAFLVRSLRPGRYLLRVRALGYAPLARAGVEVAAGGAADLGRLTLAQVATQLGNVQVVGERDETALAPDRNAFNTKDLPAAAGGTAVDVLRNVPQVEVDGDNNVTLRGSAVVVQINGRPTPLRGQQLGNYLAQLPANLVAKVEVATNPSAKNDPDGASGVINIVLNQRTDLGTSGGLTAATSTLGLANLNGNLGRQQGAWTGFASYGFFREQRTAEGFADRYDGLGAGAPGLFSTSVGQQRPNFHNATLRGEYKYGRYTSVAADAVLSAGTFTRGNDAFYRTVDGEGVVTSRFVQFTDARSRNANADLALAWRRTVDVAKNALSAELRLNASGNRFQNLLRQEAQGADGSPAPNAISGFTSRDLTDQRTPTWRLQSDYTRQLTPKTKLEAGVLGILRTTDTDFERANQQAGGDYVTDPARSNSFTYRERVGSVYGVLSQRVGRFDLQGGLRVEGATTRFDLETPNLAAGPNAQQRFDTRYQSLFPSAIATYNVDPKRQVKASYSRRISRPWPDQLNPFQFREDAYNTFQGNPALRPEYTDAYELGYQHSTSWGSVQLSPFFRRTPDAVRWIRTVGDDGVARGTFANVALSENYGTDLNVNVRAGRGGRLTLFGGGSVFGARTDARNVTPDVSFETGGWSARGNATFKLSPLYDFSAFTMYRSPQATEGGRQRYFAMSTLALKRKLRGDAATLTLRAQDPFNTMGWGVRTTTGQTVQVVDRQFGARALGLAFNYSFGQAPRFRPPANDGQQPAQGAPGGGPPG